MFEVIQLVAIGLKLEPCPNSPVAKVMALGHDTASPTRPQLTQVKSVGLSTSHETAGKLVK